MNVLTDQQRNGIRAAILNADAEWPSLNVPWKGMSAEKVAALTDNELRVYGSWLGSIDDAVGQVRAQVGNAGMVVNDRTCSGCGGEPGACTCKPTPTPTGNAGGAEGLEARFVIHAVGDSCFMTTLGDDGSLPFDVDEPPARPAPSYLGAAGPPPMVGNEEVGPRVTTEMMDSLFRKDYEARLAVNNQLRSGALRSMKGEREQRATVVNRKDLDYLPPVTAEMFGWPR